MTWPRQTFAERSFGAFADALGMKPLREGFDAWQRLCLAQAEECVALAGYLGVVADVCTDAALTRLPAQVRMAADGGEPVRTPLALMKLWAEALDGSMHEAMLSERGLDATAATVRAASRRRLQVQQVAEGLRAAFGIATREEIDDLHLEVHELKRELRRLERQLRRTEAA